MTRHVEKQRPRLVSTTLRSRWTKHRTVILLVAIIFMALVALPWLTLNMVKLLWEQPPWGAADLNYRYEEVQCWFAGEPVYSKLDSAVYPPASYTMLWPWFGWLAYTPAKVMWAATSVIALGWLASLLVKESGANTRLERVFVMLMALSMYATGFSLGHGQLTLPVLSLLVAGLTRVCRGQPTWPNDLIGAVLVLAALVKPTVSAPFFWLLLFVPATLRTALLVVLGYVALTLLAIPFQGVDLFTLHHAWAVQGVKGAAWGAITGGYGDLHSWLAALGLQQWNLPASLLVLFVLGYWTFRHRHTDVWLLCGVIAIVARFWVYHRAYDDMLMLLPMISLFRLARQGSSSHSDDVVAGSLLAVTMMAMFIPALIFVLTAWEPLLKQGQTIVRIVMLIFLVSRATPRSDSKDGHMAFSKQRLGKYPQLT